MPQRPAEAIADGWRSCATRRRSADAAPGRRGRGHAGRDRRRRRRCRGVHSAGDVTGPDGRPVPGHWLQLPDGTAVVELAQCSGLPLMAAPDPLGATTRGLGEVIAAALDARRPSLVIGLGGSASTDGGAGALAALGLRLLDADGRPSATAAASSPRLARIDRSRPAAARRRAA